MGIIVPDIPTANNGGTYTTAVTAGTSSDTVIKATPGRLCKVLITTAGTHALVIYDNASTHSGTVLCSIAANAAAGTLAALDMPAANSITVAGDSNNPAFTVSWA